MNNINARIKARIEELGIKQQVVADRINAAAKKDGLDLNYQNTTISNWVRNVSKPDVDVLGYVCIALDTDANTLFLFNEKQEKKDLKRSLEETLINNGYFENGDLTEETLKTLLTFVENNKEFLSNNRGEIEIDKLIAFINANKDLFTKRG